VYRLYDTPAHQLLDQSGLYRLAFWRERLKFREFRALDGIDLTIAKGERVGIIGRNGAGKTTLLKLITGNFRPTTGRLEVDGTVQALMQLGMGFHQEFSGYENIRGALIYNGLAGRELAQTIDDVIDFVELGEFLHQPLRTYSMGMNARLQFATATAIRPNILIIDEVLGAGDAYFAAKSAMRMRELTSSDCTLLLVSHSTGQVLQFCERVIWLHNGQIRMTGPALDVVKAYEEYTASLTQRERVTTQSIQVPEAVPANDYVTPDWQKKLLTEGLVGSLPGVQQTEVSEGISRWAAETGLKIVRVEVFAESDRATGVVCSGRPMSIEVEIVAELTQLFTFQIAILIMTLEGVGVIRHLSEPFRIAMTAGKRRSIRLRYDRTLLANGEFIFSAAVFKFYDPEDSSTAIRYDLLSRSFRLKVLPVHHSEPAIFNHPCHWEVVPLPSNADAAQ
jgi:lipopolysaccharide transport system ATP-binding protein